MHYNPIKHIFSFLVILLTVFLSSSMYAQDVLQLGVAIDGEAAGDGFGRAVALSDDGTILSVGTNNNDGNGNILPVVTVFVLFSLIIGNGCIGKVLYFLIAL